MSKRQKVPRAILRTVILLEGTVTGFAAFDPNEKELGDKVVKCDVVMKDEAGEVVAKVLNHNTLLCDSPNFAPERYDL